MGFVSAERRERLKQDSRASIGPLLSPPRGSRALLGRADASRLEPQEHRDVVFAELYCTVQCIGKLRVKI